jgi:hypothetical protein
MPDGFDVCMFGTRGEANDLAWRLATTVTGRTGAVVTDWAYHGVSSAIADLSPEIWERGVKPDHVETIPAPDGDLGRYSSSEPGWAERYAGHLDDAVAALGARGHELAVVYVDAAFTSDGILAPPPEYYRELVRRVHEAGGLFVADEVQSGHGRFGDHLWGFQTFGVVPDFVTLGVDGQAPGGGGRSPQRHRRPVRQADGFNVREPVACAGPRGARRPRGRRGPRAGRRHRPGARALVKPRAGPPRGLWSGPWTAGRGGVRGRDGDPDAELSSVRTPCASAS